MITPILLVIFFALNALLAPSQESLDNLSAYNDYLVLCQQLPNKADRTECQSYLYDEHERASK